MGIGRQGKFIVFEGIDGCGKSTQSEILVKRLETEGIEVKWSREPGSPHIGLKLRDLILSHQEVEPHALELLLQADRAEHTAWVKKTVKEGTWVVSDRSYISGLAYAKANGHDMQKIQAILKFALQIYPETIIYLDVPVSTGLDRKLQGALTREERKGPEFIQKVKDNYDDIIKTFKAYSHIDILHLDGTEDKEDIAFDVWDHVSQKHVG